MRDGLLRKAKQLNLKVGTFLNVPVLTMAMTNRLDQIACRLLGIAYIEFVDIEPDPNGDEWPEVLTTLPNGKQVSYPHNGDSSDRASMANVAHEDALADGSVKEVRWIGTS